MKNVVPELAEEGQFGSPVTSVDVNINIKPKDWSIYFPDIDGVDIPTDDAPLVLADDSLTADGRRSKDLYHYNYLKEPGSKRPASLYVVPLINTSTPPGNLLLFANF